MERKKKICILCEQEKYIFSKKRCLECSKLEYANKSELNKSKKAIPRVSEKNKEAKKAKRELLNPFFSYHIEMIKKNPYCDNCGIKIEASHFHVAHILPKNKYPSIMNNLDNALYLCTSILGGNGCHEDYDKLQNTEEGIYQALEKQCIEKLIHRFKKINYLCSEKGKGLTVLNNIIN